MLHALGNDPTGTVNGVHFRLYYDIDPDDGDFAPGTDLEYPTDIIAGTGGNPDMVPPFQAEWDLSDRAHYSWAAGTPYDTLAVRNFFVRVSAITQSRYITDQFTLVHVTDNVPPTPEILPYDVNANLTVNPNGSINYDYHNTANNNITFNTSFINWPDAYKAIFEISKVGSTDDPVVIESADLANPGDQVSVVWNYGNADPDYDPTGTYEVSVRGLQYAENRVAISVATHLATIVIGNPANSVTYNMNLMDIVDYDDHRAIDAEYGNLLDADGNWDNPFTNLRLNASFSNLNGIEKFRFRKTKIDMVGIEQDSTTTITNDQAWQADYEFDADGYISADQVVDNNAYVFLNDIDYQTDNGEDYLYKFWVELIPTHDVSNDLHVAYTTLQIDNRAPQVTLTNTSGIDPVSWAPGKQGSFRVTANNPAYDTNAEIATKVLQWSINGTDWHNTVPQLTYDAANTRYDAMNWNIVGGSDNTFLGENYFGPVQIRVRVTDNKGNQATVALNPNINVDNEAPTNIRFTDVIYYSDVYPNPTPIDNVANAPDTLNIVTSTQGTNGNGSSNLQLLVNASELDTDAAMPLMMYHQTPNGNWQNVEYDHEAWNLGNNANPDFFEFVIPNTMLAEGSHRFVLVCKDAMHNLEGDIADAINLTYNVNGKLTDSEKAMAVDLIVNVTSIDDVIATIQYPADMAYIGGRKAIAATVDLEHISEVEQIRFDHKVNGEWVEGTIVDKNQPQPITFELLRSDIPEFDYLPWVPGIHLFNDATELGELTYAPADSSWTRDVVLNAGTTYTFKYGVDLNNNGIWDDGEPKIDDPKGFNVFTPTPWILAFNSHDYAQGLHEFRAVPLGVVTDPDLAPVKWLVIDNVKPYINSITSVGNIRNATPGTSIPFVTDVDENLVSVVNELLVAADDMVEVLYQYSGQPVGTVNRKWLTWPGGNSTTMNGNYPVNWVAVNPLIDNVDNNGNGLVDEASEINGTFYIRSLASDRAGNYDMSSEFAIGIDGSPAVMSLTKIESTILANMNYIFNIPAEADSVTLTANEPFNVRDAVKAEFKFRKKLAIEDNWSVWTQLAADFEIVNGEATTELFDITEGYYQFVVTAYDVLGNNSSITTNVIFNDVTGPEINFTQVGTRDVISGEYAFAQTMDAFDSNGTLEAWVSNRNGISAITFEYALPATPNNWVNITTVAGSIIIPDATGDGGTIMINNWSLPALRTPLLLLKATAQDGNAVNMSSKTVKLYVDDTAPQAVTAITHTVYDGKMVVDRRANVITTLTYDPLTLNNDGILDVASVTLTLYNPNNAVNPSIDSLYTDVNMAATAFTFTPNDMATMVEGIDSLVVVITDFAGNTSTTTAFPALYFDVYAPDINSIASIAPNMNNTVANGESITFNVNYEDLIGLPSDALKVLFKINGVVRDSVETYTVIDSMNIQFTWTPNDFDGHFANGNMNPVVVNAVLTLNDYLHHTSVPENFNVNLTYGTPNTTRMLMVKDWYYNLNYTPHGNELMYESNDNLVNWVDEIGTISEPISVDREPGIVGGAPHPVDVELYAYVARQIDENPTDVKFYYQAVNSTTAPVLIGSATEVNNGVNSPFVNMQFFGQYSQEYSINWNLKNNNVPLPSGRYKVITKSIFSSGSTSSVVELDIFNESLIPKSIVEDAITAVPFNQVERGETYTLALQEPIESNELALGLVYKYRYVNPANNNSPISDWTYFRDEPGNDMTDWLVDPYTFDWTIYPHYVNNNYMQIVAIALDRWGNETTSGSALPWAQIVKIVNTTAPAIDSIRVDGYAPLAKISGNITPQVTVRAYIDTDSVPEDLDQVVFSYKFNTDALPTVFETLSQFNLTDTDNGLEATAVLNIPNDETIDSCYVEVTATDIFGHTSSNALSLIIDNVPPAAIPGFVVTQNGVELNNTLERGVTAILDANPVDAVSPVLMVRYSYAKAPVALADTLWLNPDTNLLGEVIKTEAPWTYEWSVPEDLEFGATYLVKATLVDSIATVAGNESTLIRSFVITDSDTPMLIVSVAGHAPQNGIIPVRLHDDVNIVTEVNDANIMRVEYLIRSGVTQPWIHLAYRDVVNAHADTLLSDVFTAYPAGVYQFGVRAREARATLGEIADFVTITLDHNIAVTYTGTMPVAFNGDEFVVNYTVTSDDLVDDNSIALQARIIG
ncbi:MAG: hypothetical protein PHO32_04455, partial [Candidatus Cloacimonetes bacterium]|nr:hypothetical protein [Candidatus Cloacimonadota bacterium]